ncbi:MAG: lipopolysaccharide biosynthesis protein [Candidatus Eiseniibacteriota bacterium]
MAPPRFVRDTAGIALSGYLSRFVQLFRGLIAARILGPAAYGSWNALLLVLDYGLLSQLGLQQGLDQEVPGSIASDPPEKTERLKRGGLSGMMLLWSVFSLGVIVYMLIRPRRLGEGWGLPGVAIMLVAVLLQEIVFYFCTILRSHGRIGEVSKTLSLQALVGGIAGLLLVLWIGLWGLLWGWLLGQVVALVYARRRGGDVVPFGFDLNEWTRRLLIVGFPIFLFTAAGAVLKTVDRMLILKFLSTEDLGLYSVGLMAMALLLYLPESVSFVLYPRMITKYRRTQDADATALELVRPLAAVAWTLPFLVGATFFWVEPVLGLLLPQYLPGAGAVSILLFGSIGLGLASIPSFYIIAIGRQTRLVPLAAGAVLLDVILVLGFLGAGWKLSGVALGVSAGYFLYGIGLLTYAASHLAGSPARRFGFVVRAVLPAVAAMMLCLTLEFAIGPRLDPTWQPWMREGLLSIGFVALYLLFARIVGPGTGIVGLMRDSNWPFARLLAGAWVRE